MKRSWPLILVAAGVLLLVGGFAYDVVFAGIPYQDPTPEMSARYDAHARVASALRWSGAVPLVVGSVAALVRRVARRFRPPGATRAGSRR